MRYLWSSFPKSGLIAQDHPYHYRGFGLNIASEIEFPELYADEFDRPDITIALDGIAGAGFDGRDPGKMFYDFGADNFILNIPRTARYRVCEGREIHMDPFPGAALRDARIYVLTVAMAALLMQRGRILLHASGILYRDKLQLFTGDSGAGKSTIVAELRKRGHILFSDDICVLTALEGGGPGYGAYASYPMMKLWQGTISELDDGRYDTANRVWSDTEKFGQFFHEGFMVHPYPIERVFVLDPSAGHASYRARDVGGLEAFRLLTEHTYRKQFIHLIELQAAHVRAMSGLVKGAEIRVLERPLEGGSIGSFADFVEGLL